MKSARKAVCRGRDCNKREGPDTLLRVWEGAWGWGWREEGVLGRRKDALGREKSVRIESQHVQFWKIQTVYSGWRKAGRR